MYQLTILMDALAASKPEDIVTLQRVARALADDPIIWDLVKKIEEHEKNRMADIEKLKAHSPRWKKGWYANAQIFHLLQRTVRRSTAGGGESALVGSIICLTSGLPAQRIGDDTEPKGRAFASAIIRHAAKYHQGHLNFVMGFSVELIAFMLIGHCETQDPGALQFSRRTSPMDFSSSARSQFRMMESRSFQANWGTRSGPTARSSSKA